MKTLIYGGTIVNEGREFQGSIILTDDRIADIIESTETPRGNFDALVDATGCCVLPGVIDSHVHFREPGLTHKADISSESRAAAYGGVTTYFEMPNTKPQTTSQEALDEKFRLAKETSRVNYSFFPGATNDNEDFLRNLDTHRVPGIKLFMGSSTGNMLVDDRESLARIFQLAAEKGLVLMAHCEDTTIINNNMAALCEQLHTDDPDVINHHLIRSEEACYESTRLGVELAVEHHTPFHVAHITTQREMALIVEGAALGGYRDNGMANVTAEVCVPHLLFSFTDMEQLGARIKCNPAVKTIADREALRKELTNLFVRTVSTDHAPHTLDEKQGGAARAVSGMPMVQFSLPAMLTLADEGVLPVSQVVQLMCHNQARLFSLAERGYLRKGYKADITIVRHEQWTVTKECIQSKCGWSPLEGRSLHWRVVKTICNGHIIYDNGHFDDNYRGEEVVFEASRG